MAIAIEGATIVARLDRIADLVEGGLDAVRQLQVGTCSIAFADHELWRCAFMVDAEAIEFLDRLKQLGLNAMPGPDPDVVLTNEFDLEVTPYCEWLKLARIQKAVIAWLDGTEPTSIVAHDGWSLENGSGLERHSETEAGLEFLRREGGIEAYFDKKAGKEVYLARKDPSVDALNAAFKKSAEDIHANWIQPGQKPISGKSAAAVQTAIRALEEVVASCPEHWQSHLMIGKGWQALGNEQAAYDAMGLAFQHCEDNESVPREFAGLCLQMGRADEAVRIGERAASLRPDNHETLGNLACAYLVSGHFVEAKKTIDAALKLNPSDSINRNLARILNDVSSGRRPQPRNLIELMTEPQQDKSFWKQLQFWER